MSRGLVRGLQVNSSRECNTLLRMAQLEEVVRRLLRSGGGYEDRSLVGAQHFQPAGDVPGVTQLTVEATVGAQESTAHFRNQFFDCIRVIPESLPY